MEEEAAIVREIFSNIAEGSTLYGEAQRLNDLGIPGPGWKYRAGHASTRRAGPLALSASSSTRAPTVGLTWYGSPGETLTWRGSARPWCQKSSSSKPSHG